MLSQSEHIGLQHVCKYIIAPYGQCTMRNSLDLQIGVVVIYLSKASNLGNISHHQAVLASPKLGRLSL